MGRPGYRVLYRGEDTLGVEKLPGIPTVGPDGLESIILREYPGFAPCHRLDAMTGGVVLFARGKAYDAYLEQFSAHTMEKRYWAVTRGAVKEGEYTHHLVKDRRGMVRTVPSRTHASRTAVAWFETAVAREGIALVRCLPRTGRTHQLRVQLSALGHPILGDDRYGSREFNRAYGARYQALWADTLIVTEEDGTPLTLYSPPRFPQKALSALGLSAAYFAAPDGKEAQDED